MERIDPTQIAEAILAAPGWARVGIAAPSQHMREDAACELANVIADKLEHHSELDTSSRLAL